MEQITKEDIEKNLKRVDEGKPLTIPLAILNGIFKQKYFSKQYYKQYREKNKEKIKQYREKNKEKIKQYYERKKKYGVEK